jgi:TolB protein
VAFITARWRLELILANLRTGNVRALMRHSPFLWAPAFAPAGRPLAYSRSEVDGAWHVWITDVDGGTPRQLTATDRGEVYPRWTPDGRFVLFHNWSPPRRIWRISPEGGPPAPVTPDDRDASYGDVSPDGRTIAFVITDAAQERVYVMPIAGGQEPRLLRAGSASLPRWSPNGDLIAFTSNRGYFGGIFVITPDGTGERRLTESGGWPVWWPDGKRIAYLTLRPDTTQQIETVTLDGVVSTPAVPFKYAGNNAPLDIGRDGESLATSNAVHISSEIWVLEPGT